MADPIAFTPAPNQPSLPPSDTPPNGRVVRTDPAQRVEAPTPHLEPQPEMQPVPIPTGDGLLVDPESGDKYRPFELNGVTMRCAAEIPADYMLDVIASQQKLADKDPEDMTPAEQLEGVQIIGDMLRAVIWDEDFPLLRQALTNKRRPIGIARLAPIVQELWSSYNLSAGVGKEQPGS